MIKEKKCKNIKNRLLRTDEQVEEWAELAYLYIVYTSNVRLWARKLKDYISTSFLKNQRKLGRKVATAKWPCP